MKVGNNRVWVRRMEGVMEKRGKKLDGFGFDLLVWDWKGFKRSLFCDKGEVGIE